MEHTSDVMALDELLRECFKDQMHYGRLFKGKACKKKFIETVMKMNGKTAIEE